jgi:glycosyltransferase involved in cell wall biosynthesis
LNHQQATQLLAIYLLTHNRPEQALEAIESILAQSDSRFELVVSDNSNTDQLHQLLGDRQGLIYIKRTQVLSGIDHGNTVLSEVAVNKKYDYFTLFHDDDLMLSNYVSDFWKAQTLFPKAIAFGANAVIERHGVHAGLSFRSAKSYIGTISPNQLLRRYFSHHQLGIAPLPSYIYKRSALDQLRFDIHGGKYCDVQWLSSWASKGQMMWISAPMMVYRFHENNDGNVESRQDRLRFLAFLKSFKQTLSPEILSDYRNFLYKKLISTFKDDKYARRLKTLSQFIRSHRYKRLLRLSLYQALLNKLLTRICMQFTKSNESA